MPEETSNPEAPNSEQSRHDIALTDVMLAMDVVDTLRHQRSLVDRELDADTRDAELVARVRKIYSDQGIEVSDRVVNEGVAALREQRFAYRAVAPGWKTRFFTMWVSRRRLSRNAGVLASLIAIISLAYFALVSWPESRAQTAAAQQLNSEIQKADQSLLGLNDRRRRAQGALSQTPAERGEHSSTAAAIRDKAETALQDSGQLLESAAILVQNPAFDKDRYKNDGVSAKEKLQRQDKLLAEAQQKIVAAEAGIADLRALRELPQQLQRLQKSAFRVAKTEYARGEIGREYATAIEALERGDMQVARRSAASLRVIAELLSSAYTIRIVSRPGEYSAVWRVPDANSNARNYYLIVEARDEDNNPVAVDVTSEEDNSTRRVTSWGLRVSESHYRKIGNDKRDDGIIQNNLVGEKRRGHLKPDYSQPVRGGAITNWKDG